MASLIHGKDEILKIVEEIGNDMEMTKEDIANSDMCHDIFILAVRIYDSRQKEEERLRNEA